MKKQFLFLLCLLAALCLLFAGCSAREAKNEASAAAAQADETDDLLTLNHNNIFDEAKYLAQKAGYPCAPVGEVRSDWPDGHAVEASAFCFGEDGVGFCCPVIDTGMQKTWVCILGTRDYGATWQVHSTQYIFFSYLSGQPVTVGDRVYFMETNAMECSESVFIINRDGSDPVERDLDDILPAKEKKDEDYSYKIRDLMANGDGGVTVTVAALANDSGKILRVFDHTFTDPLLEPELTPLPDALKNDAYRGSPCNFRRSYELARWLANEAGYGCECLPDAPERVGAMPKHVCSFGEDGVGFCLLAADTHSQTNSYFVFGTADGGKTWNAAPELIWFPGAVTAPPLRGGSYAYLIPERPWNSFTKILAVKTDGSEAVDISAANLQPAAGQGDQNRIAFASFAVNGDGSVTVGFSSFADPDSDKMIVFERTFEQPLPFYAERN